MTDTINTPDETIEVTHDPDTAELYATGVTVSQTEKVNLGNYENREVYANLRVQIAPALAMTHDTEDELGQVPEYAHGAVSEHVERQVADAKTSGVEYE